MSARDEHRKRIEEVLEISNAIYMEVDGYYVYGPKSYSGFNTAEDLRVIADILDERNAAWHKQVMQDKSI